ncbi:MAG TPA: TonB-dependent receptor plug domain-containing protein [Opitutaceae bacterium]|nr:TonB-dependent receptor plug domain-containing protein [Opitutaceae bacterium]
MPSAHWFPKPALLALCALTVPSLARSQGASSPPSSPPAAEEEVLTLSPFSVSSSQTARYQADESATGGRIRASVMDTPATVTVLTRDFIQDVGTLRVLDAAKYVAGISEATIPNGLDRVNIRGFQSDGRRVDGFSTNDQANYDSAGIERMEVIKGPDSLLQPAGVPGGTINLVTKRPQFRASGYVTVQAGQYDSNRIEADSTGPINSKRTLAYRVVGSLHDSEGYIDRSFRKSQFFSPSLTWRLAPSSELTLRYEYYNFRTHVLEGLPVDPTVGTQDAFRLLPGIAHDFSPALDDAVEFRKVLSHTGSLLFTSNVTDRLSVRVAGRIAEIDTPDSGFGWGPNTQGGSRNPLTGLWVGGLIYSSTAPYTATPAPALSRTFTHSGTFQTQVLRYRDLQNDWAYSLEGAYVKSLTTVGFAYGFEQQHLTARIQTAQPFNLDAFVRDSNPPTQAALNTDRVRELTRAQFYLTEKASFLNERLILSGGVANLSFNGIFGNRLTNNGRIFSGDGNATTVNYGVVVKPISDVSLYYGHSENAVPSSNFEQVTNGSAPTFAEGTQNEIGVKVQLLNKRLIAGLAYYEIDQSGYTIANPANLTSPPPPVLLPALVTSRKAKGWEYQLTAALTSELSIIASYADTTNRDPNGVEFRGSAEKMGALFVRYEFKSGRLEGLAAGLGLNYLGRRAGDQASGYTAASTSTQLIPNQPSFYLPSRTLTDLNLTYSRGAWGYRIAVNNLFDEMDYAASQTRFSVYIGNPRNLSASVTYKF